MRQREPRDKKGTPGQRQATPGEPKPGDTQRLTHYDVQGRPRMVDISGKPVSAREAVATGRVRMTTEALSALGDLPKGDALLTAELAGVQAAKRTAELIPLCHPLPLTLVEVRCVIDDAIPGVRIEARVRCDAQTGAEMEALTAVSVAALTIIDMVKSLDRWMEIEQISLQSKRGGKSGDVRRPADRT